MITTNRTKFLDYLDKFLPKKLGTNEVIEIADKAAWIYGETTSYLEDERNSFRDRVHELEGQLTQLKNSYRMLESSWLGREERVKDLEADKIRLREAINCLLIGIRAVAVPHNGERAVLQEAVTEAMKLRDAASGKVAAT